MKEYLLSMFYFYIYDISFNDYCTQCENRGRCDIINKPTKDCFKHGNVNTYLDKCCSYGDFGNQFKEVKRISLEMLDVGAEV